MWQTLKAVIKNRCSLNLGKDFCEGHPNFSEHIVTAAACKFCSSLEVACIRGIFEILEKFYEFHVKLLVDFSR